MISTGLPVALQKSQNYLPSLHYYSSSVLCTVTMSGTNPAGINSDLSNPDYIAYTNSPQLLTQAGILFGVTAFVIFLRCYVRVVMLRCFGKDDWTMLLAFAFATATFLVYAEQTKVGLGKHLSVMRMDTEMERQFLRLRQVQSIIVGIGVGLFKISIAYFLLRLVTRKVYTLFLRGFIVFMVLFTTACIGTLGMRLRDGDEWAA
jgi:hypothetical protein